MDKKLIVKKTFEVLHNANLVFEIKKFTTDLGNALTENEITISEKTVQEMLKQLTANNYLSFDGEYYIKGEKLLTNPKSKQRYLLSTIINDYAKDYDADYVKESYLKTVKQTENTPGIYQSSLEESYEIIKNNLIENKIIAVNRDNQIDVNQEL